MDVSFVPYFVMFRIRCSHTKVRKSVGEDVKVNSEQKSQYDSCH